MVKDCLSEFDVVILAGGQGSRVAEILGNTPKILAPIDGQPYIQFLSLWLKRFGVRRIILGLGHLAEPVIDFIENNPIENIMFTPVIEDRPLGTAGAIKNMRSLLKSSSILVMNGDSFLDVDLCEFVDFHFTERSDVSILCTLIANSNRYGSVIINEKKQITAFEEKSNQGEQGHISAGIYLFNGRVIDEISNSGPSLERDFFQRQPAGRIKAMRTSGEFIDIGTPEDLKRAPYIFRKYFN